MKLTKKITLAGMLFAIIIIMQLLKNISPFISGPVINTVLVISASALGLGWGVVFSIIVPLTSIIAPTSGMTIVGGLTYGMTYPIIMLGNIILVLCSYFGNKKGMKIFIISLIVGAIAKWLFMWGCGDLIIKPIFAESLGDKVKIVNTIFSTLQLYSGLLSIVIIIPVSKAVEKIRK